MARKPPTASAQPTAVILAGRLRAALAGDPDFAIDDVPTVTAGVAEPGAVFHVTDHAGGRIRIRVNRV